MKKILHFVYYVLGTLLCYICLFWWKIRDWFSPPKTDSILFVAHPDDDTLFFHTFIKETKPYVCLMTTGWSLRRMPDFYKCMKLYGVRYRAYPLGSVDDRQRLLEKHARAVLSIAPFKVIATHNADGEYGHIEHSRVHKAIISVVNARYRIMCPVSRTEINNYPLDDKTIAEKITIFKNVYVTESWVPYDQKAGTPVWVTHEHLEVINEEKSF